MYFYIQSFGVGIFVFANCLNVGWSLLNEDEEKELVIHFIDYILIQLSVSAAHSLIAETKSRLENIFAVTLRDLNLN